MMVLDYETSRYAVCYESLYGIGYILRKADWVTTELITGSDMVELRRTLNRAKTNGGCTRKRYRPFCEIADAILSEYVPLYQHCPR